MEGSPLSDAYKYARAAVEETTRSNPVAASENHELAAESFAAAAATTKDTEALRVLKLLEAHHKKLGQILKDGPSKPSQSAKRDSSIKTAAAGTISQPPRLARTGISSGRDLSSSIASNLASARGIPHTRQKRTTPVSPLVSNQHADGTFTQDIAEHRGESTANAETSSTRPVTSNLANETSISTSNSPFSHFYTRFENAISTLTAPLAFASLPLSQQPTPKADKDIRAQPQPQPSPQSLRKVSSKGEPTLASIDYSQLISSAALRAVRDHDPKPHESFMLVPTSGGMMSYADITAANYIDRQITRHQHHRDLSHGSNDDFVDASSQILSGPPVPSLLGIQSTKSGDRTLSHGNVQKYQGKTMEELSLDNVVLRRTLNDTTKRLQAYESLAQQQTSVLAQSIRSLQASPLTTPVNSQGRTASSGKAVQGAGMDLASAMLQKRVEELEGMMRKYDRKLGRRDEENEKLKETLGRYREKWEGLKAGAKARREQAGGGGSAGDKDKEKPRRTNKEGLNAMVAGSSPAKDTGQTEEGRKADSA